MTDMAGENMFFSFFISALLICGVIGERNVLPEKTSPEQLKARNKLPVQTITTEHGDVYDCIDFFEQPAFDHPLLKNHDYHFDMKPISKPKEIKNNGKDKIDRFNRTRIGCPRGTIPIRSTMKETFTSEESAHPNSQTNDDAPKIYYAGTSTKDGIGKIYGASASLSLENPVVYYDNEFSSSIISIGNGHEFLHAGWTVNKQLYGDVHTRYFIWMHAAHASCFNTRCPGFVIVNNDFALDSILMRADIASEARHEIKVSIYQEKESGNWWLLDQNDEEIGFWPKHLFDTLSDGAYKAYYGGVVSVPPGVPRWTQMGTGNRPKNSDTPGNSYSRHMTIVNRENKQEYAADKSDILETLNSRYVARNLHMYWYNRRQAWASTILFGGQ